MACEASFESIRQHQVPAWFHDAKLGIFVHWGLYSIPGWAPTTGELPDVIANEGASAWFARNPYAEWYANTIRIPKSESAAYHAQHYGADFKYEQFAPQFNQGVQNWNPDSWADLFKSAGARYVVLTTKHHDGFCMFDTRTTDYRLTSPNTPFHDDARANVTKHIFDAFRAEGLWTGAYFSKPDWHSPDYWWPYFPPKDRSVNYLPTKHPERCQKFKDYSYTQIEELMTGYGPGDILWLDGGWVRPLNSIDTSVSWQKAITIEQDIDMPRIAAMARKHQPGLLVVDRTVGGEYENYVTPEGHVPAADLGVPWETCMPMGTSWSWVPNEKYKSTDEIIRTLVSVVSRGGSLLLNVAPGPDGQLDSTAYVLSLIHI